MSTVKSAQSESTNNSAYNQLYFQVMQIIKENIATAIPVRVESVEGGGVAPVGFLSATPLKAMYDNFGNILPSTTISRMPYLRYQGGKVAIIADPIPGDVGIAIFAQQDISNLGTEPTKPDTFRAFDMADGMYIGGIAPNKEPETYIQLTQEGEIKVIAPKSILLEAGEEITLNAPQITLEGEITTTSQTGDSGTMSINGNINQQGQHVSTGDQVASGVSQVNHTHSGVTPGSGNTAKPN